MRLRFRARPSIALAAACTGLFLTSAAEANPTIVVDARTGAVVEATEATRPWYPASLSKLMTLYTAFKLMADNHVAGGTPLMVSKAAARQAPSKMGYAPGTLVTVDDALKMLVVHSANDIAVVLAENLGGSVEGFAAQMNRYSQGLGMRESHWANPNGLPDPRQITSARDMAILARAIIREFPDQAKLFRIQTIQSGEQIMRTHNPLLYRYAGTDGMKTGFTCSAGFNIVATVTRGNQQLITVIMGAPTAKARTEQAVQLFESSFAMGGPALFASRPTPDRLPASKATTPFDMKPIACNPKRGGSAKAQNEDMAETESPALPTQQGGAQTNTLAFAQGPAGQTVPPDPVAAGLLAAHWVLDPPIVVGPYKGTLPPLKIAADAAADQMPAALGAIRQGGAQQSDGPLPGQIPMQRAKPAPAAAATAAPTEAAPAPSPAKPHKPAKHVVHKPEVKSGTKAAARKPLLKTTPAKPAASAAAGTPATP